MKQIGELATDIERARSAFIDLLHSIGPADLTAPIGAERWSPAEYLEHLVLAEEATLWRMFKSVEDWRGRGKCLTSATPDDTIEEIAERTWGERVEAPPLTVPVFGGPATYWIVRMQRNAGLVDAFAELVRQDELDMLSYPHPISGLLTMRQGMQFVRFHLERHRNHIADAGFGSG